MKKKEINVFIFRRDLRIQDNSALNVLLENHDLPIIPIFIFNPKQIDPKLNTYFNKNAVEFMVQSLKELEIKGHVYCFEGSDVEVLNKLLKVFQIHTVAFNSDYTPFAKQRDKIIDDWCDEKNIQVVTCQDYTLLPLPSKKTYQVFTPFYNNFMNKLAKDVAIPKVLNQNLYSKFLKDKSQIKNLLVKDINKYYNEPNPNQALKGGRTHALIIFDRVKRGEFKNYEKLRNFPSMNKTTRLSAYIKFGCVSVREVYHLFLRNKALQRELLWREFYANITNAHPRILKGQLDCRVKNESFRKDPINNHKQNKSYWDAWLQAKTGFPFVDAGIRQLVATGFCHNRLRMVLGMFFCKDMMMDWTIFEHWMAIHLIDYDPSSNSGGVQWCCSIGADAAPYFRVFNPFLQSERYDPNVSI